MPENSYKSCTAQPVVRALLGFGGFLVAGGMLMRVPAAGFYLVTVFVLVSAVLFIRATGRRERGLNGEFGRALDASRVGQDEWLASRGEESGAA